MGKLIHRIVVNDDAELGNARQTQRNVQTMGSVSGGQPSVEAVSTGAGESTIQGQYRGLYAAKLASEFEELFDASDIEYVALTGTSGPTPLDGYYSLSGARTSPVGREGGNVQEFEGRLTKKGTKRSFWRAVATNHVSVDNDFGNTETAEVGIPASASKVRWYSDIDKSTESATVQSTVTTEHGDVDIYEATASTYGEPLLIFELPYVDEGKSDAKVWDDTEAASLLDGDGHVQWQRVFRSNHDFEGNVVLSNGKLRLTFDESAQTLTAETYSSGSWSSTALGSTTAANSWSLLDADLTEVSMNDVRAQVLWEKDDGTLFALDASLKRGYDDVLWVVPDGETGPTPTGLNDKLSPIANGQTYDVQDQMTLVRRQEVRL